MPTPRAANRRRTQPQRPESPGQQTTQPSMTARCAERCSATAFTCPISTSRRRRGDAASGPSKCARRRGARRSDHQRRSPFSERRHLSAAAQTLPLGARALTRRARTESTRRTLRSSCARSCRARRSSCGSSWQGPASLRSRVAALALGPFDRRRPTSTRAPQRRPAAPRPPRPVDVQPLALRRHRGRRPGAAAAARRRRPAPAVAGDRPRPQRGRATPRRRRSAGRRSGRAGASRPTRPSSPAESTARRPHAAPAHARPAPVACLAEAARRPAKPDDGAARSRTGPQAGQPDEQEAAPVEEDPDATMAPSIDDARE